MLEHLQKLETEGVEVIFESITYHFCGSVSMAIADNLAAHALGEFYCNFSTVNKFCRFCSCRKNQLNKNIPISNFMLLSKTVYDNNLESIELDPNFSELFGRKHNSCLHVLNYFHVTF